ncbi:MAG TPA: GAF domain-containing protein, partial [Roseiflexaceae bacterium]|nr:GAF domain-containing protein [Roseiflexaceae bacterium]
MDTRTVVMSSASVWDLLAQLASLARQRIPVPERQVVLNQIGCLVRDALGSAWGVLSVGDENTTLTSFWGIDAERAAELLGDPGTLGQEGAALSFEPGPAEQGQLMFEAGDELRELLDHGFGLALREQLGLVLAHTAPPAANDAATNGAAVAHTTRTHAGANALSERIDEALSVVLHQGAQTLAADWVAFLLVDTATGNWHVAACTTTCPQDALHTAALREPLTALAGVAVPRLLSNTDAHMQPLLEACRSAMLLASAVQPDTSTPGLLLVGYDQSIPMSTEDALILTGVLARQLASAFTNAHFNTDEHRRSGIFAALQALSQRTGTARSANEVFHTLVEGAHALMSFRASEIRAFDPVLQQLSAVLTSGIRHRTLPHYNRLSEGLAGYVARNRRSLRLGNLSDAPVKPLFQTLHSGNGSTRIQSYVGVPIVLGGQLFGTFELFSDRPNHFTVTDERLLIMLTNQAAQTLAGLQRSEETDAHLHRRIQQLRALQRISRELTATLYLHNILAFALDEACRATGASHGYIALRGYQTVQEVYDLEQEEALGVTPSPQVYISLRETSHEQAFHIITTSGYSGDEQGQLVNQALTRSVAEQTASRGETTLVDQLASDDRPRSVGPVVASVVAVPIYYEAQVIGVINLHGSMAHTFDRDALEFARAVADLAALAIGNEQRWTEQRRQRDLLQQRASTLNEVLRIGQELRADRSLTDVLEQVAFSVAEAASYRAVAFFVYLGNNDSMQFVAAAGLPLTEVERLKRVGIPEAVREQIFAREHRVGRCYFVTGDRMRELAPYLDLTEGDQAGEPNDQSWQPNDAVYVPLYSTQGHLLGLLAADEPYDRQRPTRRSVESLEIFADQAAIAIENAALLRDAREQTERMTGLYRMSASMAATFDLDELLERGYNEIVNYLGTPSFVYVAAFDIHSQQMRFELFKREGVDHERLRKATFPKGGWTGWVIDRDDVVHLRDILVDGESIPVQSIALGEEIRSWVGIPLRSQDTVIGVLSVQSFEPNAFSDQDVQFLLTLGNHRAVALEKARLFGEREARIAELNMINRVGEITSSTLSIEQMLNALYECLTGYLPIDSFFA